MSATPQPPGGARDAGLAGALAAVEAVVHAFGAASPEAREAQGHVEALRRLRDGEDPEEFFALEGRLADLQRLAWSRTIPPKVPLVPRNTAAGDGAETPAKSRNPEVSSPPAWVAFPVAALPEPIRAFVLNAAATLGCDPSYVALPLLAGLAAAVGNTLRLGLKRGWTEPAIVWAVIVGESGTQKSPALELALRPLRARQHDAMRRHAEDLAQHEQALAGWERAYAQWKRSRIDAPPPEKPERPTAARCWTDDVTIEALAGLLVQNPRGLLVARDELAGWLDFDRYQGNGGDAARWLECFGGRPLVVDRRTSGTLYVPRASVSVTGGIQPGTLRRALGEEHRENGLLARLLLACPPRCRRRWLEADLDAGIGAALEDVFARLFALEPEHNEQGTPRPRLVRLSDEAKALWVEFYNAHAAEQADLTGDLAAAWSKLEGYAARLALVAHVVARTRGGDLAVMDAPSVETGVTLSRWFAHEAERVYSMLAEDANARDRRLLVDWLRARGGTATVRELARGLRRYRGNPEAAEVALAELVRAGLAQWEDVGPGARGGRPTQLCRIVGDAGDETSDFPGNPEVSVPSPPEDPSSAADEVEDL